MIHLHVFSTNPEFKSFFDTRVRILNIVSLSKRYTMEDLQVIAILDVFVIFGA